jgi:hypothetical protein
MGQPDFKALAATLDANRGAVVSDAHWDRVRGAMAKKGRRYEAEEKASHVTPEMVHRPFTL